MKSPAMKWVGMIVWGVTSLVALNIGLTAAFGFNFFETDFMMGMSDQMHDIIGYIIGLSGVISFGMFVMSCMNPDSCK